MLAGSGVELAAPRAKPGAVRELLGMSGHFELLEVLEGEKP